ncbi:MAG TPA: hypothetical protein VHJ78_09015 [Actinomycetota bacterium]|nr:hypothetical protein [Actinomycetota bacterium]
MAVTRMRGFSFLTVQGRVSRRRLRQFSQGLQYAMHFSPLPVVVDLRNVAFVHPRALRAIIHVWLSAPDPNLALEVLIKARPRARESLLVRL